MPWHWELGCHWGSGPTALADELLGLLLYCLIRAALRWPQKGTAMGIEEDIGYLRSELAGIGASVSGIGERFATIETLTADAGARTGEALGMLQAHGERIAALEGALTVVVLDEAVEAEHQEEEQVADAVEELKELEELEELEAAEPEPEPEEPDTAPSKPKADTAPKSQHWLTKPWGKGGKK